MLGYAKNRIYLSEFFQMANDLINVVYISAHAPPSSFGPFLDIVTEHARYLAEALSGDSPPLESEHVWCSDVGSATEEIKGLEFELKEWKTLFISIEQINQEFEFALILTTFFEQSWKTRCFPWSVAKSVREDFKEIFHSQEFLKVLRTPECEHLIVMDLVGLISVMSARSLAQLNTWEYRKHDVTALENHDDAVVLGEILELYIGPKEQGTFDLIIPAPSPFDSPSPKYMWRIIRRAASLPLFFFHALLSCHSFLFGPSLLSYEPSQQLLTAADYLNNTGNVSNPWLPSLGKTEEDPFLRMDWLVPSSNVPKDRLPEKAGIKGQVGELEIIIHPDDDDMAIIGESDLELQIQRADRERAKQLLTRRGGLSPYASQLPSLDTVLEEELDPFGPLPTEEVTDEVLRGDPDLSRSSDRELVIDESRLLQDVLSENPDSPTDDGIAFLVDPDLAHQFEDASAADAPEDHDNIGPQSTTDTNSDTGDAGAETASNDDSDEQEEATASADPCSYRERCHRRRRPCCRHQRCHGGTRDRPTRQRRAAVRVGPLAGARGTRERGTSGSGRKKTGASGRTDIRNPPISFTMGLYSST